jgi:glycosyltransferase involved in cell wall biosynthesis
MKILREHYKSNCRLILCGFNHDESPSDWRPLLDSLGDDTVQLVSYLPKEEMSALYQTADFLIFPSLFEGFGLPILEAMAARCPVICANSTALPEIAGDAAVLVDPFDSAALAQAIHALLTNPAQQAELIEKGAIRAEAFSWEKTAQATLNIYEQVTGTWQVPVTLTDES